VTVNGKKAQESNRLSGQAPEGGGMIGFYMGTSKEDTGPSTFTIKSIEVREVEKGSKLSYHGSPGGSVPAVNVC
jgi:hypothetical protein